MEERLYKPVEAARILGVSREFLLSSEKNGQIPECPRDEHGNRYFTAHHIETIRDLVQLRPVLPSAPVTLAVFNMKGGVGKSTISSNLAWKIAERGFRTLAVDGDPQGHMTTSLGQEPSQFERTLLQALIPDLKRETLALRDVSCELSPTLSLVPANLSMCSMNLLLFQQPEREYRFRRAMETVRSERLYDVVVIDSPPSYDLTSLNILLACDMLLAPVKLDGNSFYGLEYLFDSVRDLARTYRYAIPTVAIVANHFNGAYSVSRQILDGLRENYAPYMMSTVIRQDVNFDKANALRQPIFVMAPTCKGSKDLEQLVDEVVEKMKKRTTAELERHEQEKT
jgi:chromosome partitioning protein